MGRAVQAGSTRLRILAPTQRCAATEVNPSTANQDLHVPRLLKKQYGHLNMGVYAEVLNDCWGYDRLQPLRYNILQSLQENAHGTTRPCPLIRCR